MEHPARMARVNIISVGRSVGLVEVLGGLKHGKDWAGTRVQGLVEQFHCQTPSWLALSLEGTEL